MGKVHVGCIVLALLNPSAAGDLAANGNIVLLVASVGESARHIHGHHCATFSDLPHCRAIDVDRSIPERATHFAAGYNRLRKNRAAIEGRRVEQRGSGKGVKVPRYLDLEAAIASFTDFRPRAVRSPKGPSEPPLGQLSGFA